MVCCVDLVYPTVMVVLMTSCYVSDFPWYSYMLTSKPGFILNLASSLKTSNNNYDCVLSTFLGLHICLSSREYTVFSSYLKIKI